MGWDTPDVYYQPEKFSLTVVAELDYSTGSYEFDCRVVWRHEDGRFFTARDAGCSCPSPFEDFTSLESLDALDVGALEAEVEAELKTDWRGPDANAAADFLKDVRACRS